MLLFLLPWPLALPRTLIVVLLVLTSEVRILVIMKILLLFNQAFDLIVMMKRCIKSFLLFLFEPLFDILVLDRLRNYRHSRSQQLNLDLQCLFKLTKLSHSCFELTCLLNLVLTAFRIGVCYHQVLLQESIFLWVY
jgi:hypothetical protein